MHRRAFAKCKKIVRTLKTEIMEVCAATLFSHGQHGRARICFLYSLFAIAAFPKLIYLLGVLNETY